MSPRERSLLGLSAAGCHRLAYAEWGAAGTARTLVCVHGLTRNGRDFDALAGSMASAGWRVACPDVVGRGGSDWLADPAGYGPPQYLADLTALIARLDVERISWVGTSMGGILGMLLAAQPGNPIERLVINDVGPLVPKAALERIAEYLGKAPRFADRAAAEAFIREVHAPFGRLSDAEWAHLTEHAIKPEGDGFVLRYDPEIRRSFGEPPFEDVDLWAVWDAIACPTLVLRGAESDLLLPETAAEMTRRGPCAELVELAGCGHAPALMAADQIAVVRAFLFG